MTSTEFTVGLTEGTRVSSKVLKPPGGGSSNIFGMENSDPVAVTKSEVNVTSSNQPFLPSKDTQSRLFGTANATETPSKSYKMQSNVFGNYETDKPTRVISSRSQKNYVRRNPITGEVIEIIPKNDKENDAKNENEIENDANNEKEYAAEAEDNKKNEAVETLPPVQTSIRVRNPPGGKSSGIF